MKEANLPTLVEMPVVCSYFLVANIVYETSTNVDLTTNTWG